MPQLFLVPASPENLWTIDPGAPLDRVEESLSENDFQFLSAAVSTNTVSCWAMTTALEATFVRMRPGDVVLLTPNRTGQFHYRGAVLLKVRHSNLGERLWGFTPGRPWTLIYFLKSVTRIAIPRPRLLRELGYPGWRNDRLQRTRRVRPERLEEALTRYGSIDRLLGAATGNGASPVRAAASGSEALPIGPDEQPVFLRPDWLRPLIEAIEVLRRDPNHLERAHEALVDSFLQALGFQQFEEIRFQEGRVDVRLQVGDSTVAVFEVKRDWGLSRHDRAVLEQAYRYAQATGARHVFVTNGDYYAWFDLRKGLGYDGQFMGAVVLSKLRTEDLQFLEGLRKNALLGSDD